MDKWQNNNIQEGNNRFSNKLFFPRTAKKIQFFSLFTVNNDKDFQQ